MQEIISDCNLDYDLCKKLRKIYIIADIIETGIGAKVYSDIAYKLRYNFMYDVRADIKLEIERGVNCYAKYIDT